MAAEAENSDMGFVAAEVQVHEPVAGIHIGKRQEGAVEGMSVVARVEDQLVVDDTGRMIELV